MVLVSYCTQGRQGALILQFARRVGQRPIRSLVPKKQLLGAVVHGHRDDDARAVTFGDVDVVRCDGTPVAGGRPILGESLQLVVVVLGMLLPFGVVHPDAVCRLVVLILEIGHKGVDLVLNRKVREEPSVPQHIATQVKQHQDHDQDSATYQQIAVSRLAVGVVLRSIQQRHRLFTSYPPILDTAAGKMDVALPRYIVHAFNARRWCSMCAM
jgi:hypothetical protein